MASTTGSSRTAPKGRATRSRSEQQSGSMIGPTMQWFIVALAILAVIGGLMYVFRDVSSPLGGGGHSGAPASVVVETQPLVEL